jgi:hypothetical protein
VGRGRYGNLFHVLPGGQPPMNFAKAVLA